MKCKKELKKYLSFAVPTLLTAFILLVWMNQTENEGTK